MGESIDDGIDILLGHEYFFFLFVLEHMIMIGSASVARTRGKNR